jgi:ribosomal-protein-alanine N-acetyltransferase
VRGVEITAGDLRLLACDEAMLAAAMRDHAHLSRLTGARIAAGWPGEDLAGVLPLMLVAAQSDSNRIGWLAWLIVVDEQIVGDIGPHAPPDERGCVEIGFSVVPSHRRRGIATRAVHAMCDHLAANGVTTIVARTGRDNAASQHVLEQAGFELASVAEAIMRYERRV